MYDKNLSEGIRLRLSSKDMDFLRDLSAQRAVSLSSCLRSIIGEYRRSFETLELHTKAIIISNIEKEDKLSNGDTKTDFNN